MTIDEGNKEKMAIILQNLKHNNATTNDVSYRIHFEIISGSWL